MDLKFKDIHNDVIKKSKSKASGEIRIEPPVPVEPVIKSNVEVKQEKVVKIDSGNTISKDAINKEEEELEKRPEIDILEKLKSHENEERKILAESKQILEEIKGAHHMQMEKNLRKPVKNLKEDNTPKILPENKKNQIDGVVKNKLPLPLVLKEVNKPINKNRTKLIVSRDKRDLTSTLHNGNNDEKEENCKKKEKSDREDSVTIKNEVNTDKYVENLNLVN